MPALGNLGRGGTPWGGSPPIAPYYPDRSSRDLFTAQGPPSPEVLDTFARQHPGFAGQQVGAPNAMANYVGAAGSQPTFPGYDPTNMGAQSGQGWSVSGAMPSLGMGAGGGYGGGQGMMPLGAWAQMMGGLGPMARSVMQQGRADPWVALGNRLRPQYEQAYQQGRIPGSPGYEAAVQQNPGLDPQTGQPWRATDQGGWGNRGTPGGPPGGGWGAALGGAAGALAGQFGGGAKPGGGMVLLRAPNGQTQAVPQEHVAHYLARGATQV